MAAADQPPEDFLCPISLQIMTDPVILSSGHTFDRASIQRWFDSGNRTCPISKKPLPENPSLIPNFALRSLISNYAVVSPAQSQTEPAEVIPILLSTTLQPVDKLALLERLTRASKRDPELRRNLVDSGAVSAVLKCIDSDETKLQEKSLHLLLNLSLDDDTKVGLVAEGILEKLVHALRSGVGDSRAVAATVVTSLSVVEVNKIAVGSYPDAIPALVDLLRTGNPREKKESATALFILSSFPKNRSTAIQCRAVPILIQNAAAGSERAVEVLNLLAKSKQGREEMAKSNSILSVLIQFLRHRHCSRGMQQSLSTLSSLCCHSEKLRREGMNVGLLDLCVGLLKCENEKIRRNAESLIRILE